MTQAVLPWCLQRYLVYGRRHHNTCPILPQSPPHGIAPGLMWLDGTWAARGRERDQVFIGRNGGERERSGVYWKPKGAAAKRAGPISILPHQVPVKLGDRCRAVDFEGVWDKCCDTICHTLSNTINAKAKMPERSLDCYVRMWTPAHIHLCNIDTHTYTRCVGANAHTHA